MKYIKNKGFMMILLITFITLLTSCAVSNEPKKTEEKLSNETLKSEIYNEGEIELSEGEIELKEKLLNIKKNNMIIDANTDVDYIIDEMIKYIGSNDSELRDDLIYGTFAEWILSGQLDTEQIKGILEELLSDDKLKYKIGEVGNDSVFTRSFSVLVIDLILRSDINKKFLTEDEIINIYNKLIDYVSKEKDYRGYVKEKGWAHAIAHSGDALSRLATYGVIDKGKLKEMLEVISSKVAINSYEYTRGEEGRLGKAILTILMRKVVDDKSLEEWVASIINYKKTGDENQNNIIHSNVNDFLEVLSRYPYMKQNKVIQSLIEEFLQKG